MTKEDVQMLIQFMQRVTLQPPEIPAYSKVMQALQMQLALQEKVADPPEDVGK